MYFPTWILLVGISLMISIAAFIWGLRSGQFSDPERARYLPFTHTASVSAGVKNPGRLGMEVYVLAVVMIVGMSLILIPAGLAVLYSINWR